jgi:hypothetical protein
MVEVLFIIMIIIGSAAFLVPQSIHSQQESLKVWSVRRKAST